MQGCYKITTYSSTWHSIRSLTFSKLHYLCCLLTILYIVKYISYSPLMPLPSSWKELRCKPKPPPKPASSRCSLPPLPDEAMLLWGERGAWSGAGPLADRRSSWDSQTWPRDWLLGPLMGGVRDTERFRGLCCWLPTPLVRTARHKTSQDVTFTHTTYLNIVGRHAFKPVSP